MTAKTLFIDQSDALDLEDELLDFTADLLALKSNQIILEDLFSLLPGQWVDLGTLLQSLPMLSQKLVDLEGLAGGKLQVTWLRHPETSDRYSLVLFFMESLGWDHLAVYHKSLIVSEPE